MSHTSRRSFFFTALYCLLMLGFVIAIAIVCQKRSRIPGNSGEKPVAGDQQTEYIYVYINKSQESEDSGDEKENEDWVLKAYQGKIGVFDRDGTLIEVLDVYLYTLPKTDQRLLEEGIEVHSRKALLALIEDYTG